MERKIMEELTQYLTILDSSEWLMSSVVVVLIMTLFSFNRQRKQQKKQELSMQSLQRDLRALANAAVGVGGVHEGVVQTVSVNIKEQLAGLMNWAGFLYHVARFSDSQLLNSNSQPVPAGACGSPPWQ